MRMLCLHSCVVKLTSISCVGAYQAPQWGDKLYSTSKTCTISAPPTAQVHPIAAVKSAGAVECGVTCLAADLDDVTKLNHLEYA